MSDNRELATLPLEQAIDLYAPRWAAALLAGQDRRRLMLDSRFVAHCLAEAVVLADQFGGDG